MILRQQHSFHPFHPQSPAPPEASPEGNRYPSRLRTMHSGSQPIQGSKASLDAVPQAGHSVSSEFSHSV